MPRYNREVSRPLAVLIAGILFLSACGKDMKSKEKVQEAILKRLETNSGLDLKTLEVNTTSVSFDKNMAYATVAFHPKGDPSLQSGMVMKYTLEDRNGQWVVTGVGNEHGHATGSAPPSTLPPGHPPVDSTNPGMPPMSNPGSGEKPQ